METITENQANDTIIGYNKASQVNFNHLEDSLAYPVCAPIPQVSSYLPEKIPKRALRGSHVFFVWFPRVPVVTNKVMMAVTL